jgi:tetratricopeptide (TPR) repeat protein
MCYYLSKLYHDSGQGGDKLIAALTKAVALKPDYAEARLQLGLAEYNRGNYQAAIAALAPIERIALEHAAVLRSVLQDSYERTGAPAAGLKHVEGEAQALDCDGPRPRLSILAGTATMTFELTDPKMTAAACGAFGKLHVAVDYLPNATRGPAVAGILKAIQF